MNLETLARSVAIVAAFILPLAAHADVCKVAAEKYIHSGKVGDNWWSYWWCEDGAWSWGVQIPSTYTAESVRASAATYLGLAVPIPTIVLPDATVAELRAAVEAAVAADQDRPLPPAPAEWVVGKTGYPDRPTYPVTNGVRGTKSDGRAIVGSVCDCSSPIVEGKTTYCPLAKSAAIGAVLSSPSTTISVTVCVKQ